MGTDCPGGSSGSACHPHHQQCPVPHCRQIRLSSGISTGHELRKQQQQQQQEEEEEEEDKQVAEKEDGAGKTGNKRARVLSDDDPSAVSEAVPAV